MNKKEFKYIEIRKHEDDSVVERINVSHKGESQIDRIEDLIEKHDPPRDKPDAYFKWNGELCIKYARLRELIWAKNLIDCL